MVLLEKRLDDSNTRVAQGKCDAGTQTGSGDPSRPVEAAGSVPSGSLPSAGHQGDPQFLNGDEVLLHGLVSRPELNYRVGSIVHYCQITNRFAVSWMDFPLSALVLV